MLNSGFWKIAFYPKIKTKRFLKVKLPNMTGRNILPGLKIDVLIACRRLSVSSQKIDCVSRYSVSGHLQKFASDYLYLHAKIHNHAKLSHYR